ncbi:uncharacterized protein Z519_07333 [Cladophialophora bantiana CBS 173.52]|uniref:Transcription factor domain-containing protein n=1 Tax=Cladophialophora bantiana (strain ATCC 10958 / CBS 173.52 / CDC B-1940 / NIH 8579) TaxID=1442370 RepID=A0A0D2I650_CLAB1|nr:uncharacterized protein Z519_07333 [Cladophialophora bantiana CBS 173.52]KIW92349.1 hypothetical protein Z519_07333 [Cladophialophora bantiana CBS 173.52]
MPSDLMFQGVFSFVNVDAASLSTLPHRQQVTRHVHGYRRWKKGQDARRLRESSRFHETIESQFNPQKFTPSRAIREDNPSETAQIPSPPSPVRSLPRLLDVVLLNGNSDPFDVLPQQLTATANSLLGFERDCVVPAVRELELRMAAKDNVPRQAAFTETWITESKAYLYDSIAIHSYLSRIAASRYMFTSSPEYLDAARKFRHKGVASLKEYMTTAPRINILRLYRAVLILLLADSSLGDRRALYQHVTALKDIFATHHAVLFADPSFNLHHYISVIYLEVQFAAMNFSRTCIDVGPNGWVEKQFLPLWEKVSPRFPISRSEADQNLDSYLKGDIRTLYLDAQETLDIIMRIRRRTPLDTSQTWVYAMSKIILTAGRLMNLYAHLDVQTILCQSDRITVSSVLQKLELASASLCAIYWLRELGGIESISMTEQTRLFTWNPVMLCRLRQILTVYEAAQLGTSEEQDNSGRLPLLLWFLWTGAMVEHSISSPTVSATESENWFIRRFSDLVGKAEIESASHCQSILDHILRLHGMRPGSGDGWTASCFSQADGP